MIPAAICFGLPLFVYVIPLVFFAARGRDGWTKMTSDGNLVVGAPLHIRIGLAIRFLGMALAGPLVSISLLSDSHEAQSGWGFVSMGAMVVLLWVLARGVPIIVMTIDLERRVYETRSRWPAPNKKRAGSLEEFDGVYMDEKSKVVYLVEKDWFKVRKDWVKGVGKRRICLGAPAAGFRTSRTQRVRAYGFAVEMSEILGLPIVQSPTSIFTRTTRVRQKLV